MGRRPKLTDANERDRKVLADPDIRGATKGRLGRQEDMHFPGPDNPVIVEFGWRQEGRG